MDLSERRGAPWVAPFAVAVLAGALGAFDLARRSYWIDEAYNVVLAREPWGTYVRTIVVREPSQAVYLLFFKPWVSVAGHSEAVARLPSVISAMIAAGLLVHLGTRLFDRRVGVLAGILLATNAGVVEWSQYARTYTLAVLGSVVTTVLFVRALERGSRRAWIVYGLAGAIAIYCHFYAGFVLVAQALCFLARRPRPPLEGLAIAWAVISAGLIPFAVYLVAGTRSPVEWIPAVSGRRMWNALLFASGTNWVLIATALLGVVVLARTRGKDPRGLLVLAGGWVVVPLLCGAAVSLVKPALVPRFLIVAAPGIALLAAYGLVHVRTTFVRAIVVCAILAVAGFRLGHVYTQNPEDWRAAATIARSAHTDGSSVAVLPSFAWRTLAIYAPDVPLVSAPAGPAVTVLVSADAVQRRDMVRAFVARSGYHHVATRRIGPALFAERWQRGS